MPQSLARLLVHVVFSTKRRAPVLGAPLRPNLTAYVATVARAAGCECLRAGGVEDHVHLAIRLARTVTVAVADLVEKFKTSSSHWLRPQIAEFAWQRGSGAFSISQDELPALLRYIDDQEAHHRQQGFQDEYRALLRRYGVSFDERFVWD